MTPNPLRIELVFSADDQAWIRRSGVAAPRFWDNHTVAPALRDVVRLGGRQFTIEARVWEHDGVSPVLRLFVGGSHAQSDTTFG
jgi:hypothetical protein